MALWRKQPLKHGWLPENGVLEMGLVRVVEVSPELDDGYLGVLDGDFLEVHHWPESTLKHLKRGLGAGRRTRHSLTKQTALLVLQTDPTSVVGFVSVSQLGVGNEPYQVGLQLHPDHRRNGIMSSLLPLLSDHLEGVHGYGSVALSTSEDNSAMIRVCEKLGYSYHLVQFRHPDGTVETARQYTLLPR